MRRQFSVFSDGLFLAATIASCSHFSQAAALSTASLREMSIRRTSFDRLPCDRLLRGLQTPTRVLCAVDNKQDHNSSSIAAAQAKQVEREEKSRHTSHEVSEISQPDTKNTSNSKRRIPTIVYEQPESKLNTEIGNGIPTLPYAEDIKYVLSRPRVEALLVGLVLLSSFSVAYGTLPDLPRSTIQIMRNLEEVISYIFATEFCLRLWASWGKQPLIQYLSKPLVLVDLVVVILPLTLSQLHGDAATVASSILPSWLMSRSGLINLRLLRILRIQRILKDLETFSNFEEALGFEKNSVRPYQLQLARVLLSVFTLLSVSTGLIYSTEHLVNPDIPDYFTALYFGLTTLTTVGFGDITPVTAQGKLVVSGSILAGVAVIPAQAAVFVEALLDYQKERDLKRQNDEIAKEQIEDGIDAATVDDKSKTKVSSPVTMNRATKFPNDGMLDARTQCTNCGATFHWSNAAFCWSCGTKLEKR